MSARFILTIFVLIVSFSASAQQSGFNKNNFTGRQALILNNSPYIELMDFSFGNVDGRNYRSESRTHLKWTNIGQQPIVAFEVVIAKYDPFGRNEVGSRWTVTGTDSANWTPLLPRATAGDGLIGTSSEDTFTAIAYVRYVRLADGTIWAADIPKVAKEIQKLVPNIKEVGDISPSTKKDKKD